MARLPDFSLCVIVPLISMSQRMPRWRNSRCRVAWSRPAISLNSRIDWYRIFKYPFWPRFEARKYPKGKDLLQDRFRPVFIGLPGVVGVDVQVEQAQPPLARGEIGGLVFFDVLVDVLRD